ncbi:MAG: ATP-binding protein [Cenarchaeum sp. SB0663_bin_5]|nr:ATP-binding protein [Cenarchaeum sp. SB0663_bin_5]MYL11504.1 ATP-binding protein [Cenarchaeum sp. SB0669_bin_11]
MSSDENIIYGREERRPVRLPMQHGTANKKFRTARWQEVPMLKSHSFLKAVREIVETASRLDLISICIVGKQSTGKSTIAQSISHVLHNELESKYGIIFNVVIWGMVQLQNIDEALKTIESNTIIIFDDISFARKIVSSHHWNKVLNTMTTIRHRGSDVRIILIFNYHYTLANDKFLRGSDYTLITSTNVAEHENMIKLYGGRHIIKYLERELHSATSTGYFGPDNPEYKKDKTKPPKLYKFRQPFSLALFHTPNGLRPIIYPHIKWLDPKCGICAAAHPNIRTESESVDDFMSNLVERYGSTAISGLKVFLAQRGILQYGKTTISARNAIAKHIRDSNTTPQALLDWFNQYKGR